MKDGIRRQVDAFKTGFNNVIGGNALSLFLPEEIQLLLCGSEDHGIDVDVLKSVTKYIGWRSPEDAANSKIITWFWDYMTKISNKEKKKLLILLLVQIGFRLQVFRIYHLKLVYLIMDKIVLVFQLHILVLTNWLYIIILQKKNLWRN